MIEFKTAVDNEVHQQLAIELFNFTWDLIEKADRTDVENDMMVHAAHASRFHWGMVGTLLNFARSEWQISRVYSVLLRGEPALVHAKKSLDLCLDGQLGDFDLGFAYEAMARAYAVEGDVTQRDEHIARAKRCAEHIDKEENRTWLHKNLETVETLTLPKWEND